MILEDNFNLSLITTAVNRTEIRQTLLQEGPFTVLAPSDAAFLLAGYNNSQGLLSLGISGMSQLANYHILDGRYELDKSPYLFNQEIQTRNGGKLYLTHWIKGADTILTVNGSRIIGKNIAASNGLIQVLDRVLEPYIHDKVGDAIASREDLTLFYQALLRSGLIERIQEDTGGPYTIFAPNNEAMEQAGFTSVEQIEDTDQETIRAFVTYHILLDRRFIYDYVLSMVDVTTEPQNMLDGNPVDVSLTPDPSIPGTYNGITLRGLGNTSSITLGSRDILAGNGVVHILNGVLMN